MTWPAVLLTAAPPLDPSREVARDWARRELSDPVYAKARPGLVQRVVGWLLDHLSHLKVPSGVLADRWTGLVLLLLAVAVVVVVALLRTGAMAGPGRRRGTGTVFADGRVDAAGHRRLADQAAAQGQWEQAVRERFRAVVRCLEERTVLDERAGRTADEAAGQAGAVLPQLAAPLASGARMFDDVVYGERAADSMQHERLRALDEAVRTVPVPGAAPVASPTSVPR